MAFQPEDSDLPQGDLCMSESSNDDMEAFLERRGRRCCRRVVVVDQEDCACGRQVTPENCLVWSNAYKRRKRSEIVTCFDWAGREGKLIASNPYYRSRSMKLPVVPPRSEDRRVPHHHALRQPLAAAGDVLP